MQERRYTFERKTRETSICGEVNLDGKGIGQIVTGIGFFDHMLDQLVFHGRMDLQLECTGDLHIDAHHSIEDVAIVLGQALREALGDKVGIRRYASCFLPMDESLTSTHLDISGRAYHVFRGSFSTPSVGGFPTEMTEHFFYSLAVNAGITLHQEIVYSSNDHHSIESLFKGFARAWQSASARRDAHRLPSTKGVL